MLRTRRRTALASAALTIAILTLAGSAGAAEAQTEPATEQLEGRLEKVVGDDFQGAHGFEEYQLRTAGAQPVPLVLNEQQVAAADRLAGRNVRVRATRRGGRLAVTALTGDATAGGGVAGIAPMVAGGTREVAVILLRNQGATTDPYTAQSVSDHVFGGTDSLKIWLEEASGGAVSITGTVLGWYPSNLPATSCDFNAWAGEAERVAGGAAALAGYEHVIIDAPDRSCTWSGAGNFNGRYIWINGSPRTHVLSHEIGHNFNLAHAGRHCDNPADVARCRLQDEYGDPFDAMGNGGGPPAPHYSAFHKHQIGFLPAASKRTISTAGITDVALTHSEHPVANATQLLEVAPATGGRYAVELRKPHGRYEPTMNGVWIREIVPSNSGGGSVRDTYLLDQTPGSPSGVRDGALAPGRTFTDSARRISIVALGGTPDRRSIRVCVEMATCPLPGPTWSGWSALGGGLAGEPRSISWGPNHLDAFMRGTDNQLWHRYNTGGGWSNWESLDGSITSDPAVVSWGAGHIDVFARGTDGRLWQRRYNGGWKPWEVRGGNLASAPTAVAMRQGRVDVFARRADNALIHKKYADGVWGEWGAVGGSIAGTPVATTWGAGRVDVFARGTDNALWHRFLSNGVWRWESLGGAMLGDPGAVSWSANRIDVFVRGTDSALRHKWFAGAWSSGWEVNGGVLTSDPEVVSWGPGRLDVFARGVDNALWTLVFDGSWRPWRSLGGGLTSKPDAVTSGPNRLDVFVRGGGNALFQQRWPA